MNNGKIRNNSFLVIFIIGVLLLFVSWKVGLFKDLIPGMVYEGSITKPVGPNCVLSNTGTVADIFQCNFDKCVVNVTYPESVIKMVVTKEIQPSQFSSSLNHFLHACGVDREGSCNGLPYCPTGYELSGGVYVPDCILEGVVVFSGRYDPTPSYISSSAINILKNNFGCDLSFNCVLNYTGSYDNTQYGVNWYDHPVCPSWPIKIKARTGCSFSLKTMYATTDKFVSVSDKGQTNIIYLNNKVDNIFNQPALKNLRTLDNIYLSKGGSVIANGAVLTYANYLQCYDCPTGTGVCLVDSVECINQTSYKKCFDGDPPNNCGVWSSSSFQTELGQACVNNKIVCNNECPAEGYASTENGGTQYKICQKSSSGCLYWGALQSCPQGVLYDVNTKSCSICVGAEACSGRQVGEKWFFNTTTYSYCEVEGICKVQKFYTCPSGLVLNDNFVCVDPNSCSDGSLKCSSDGKAVLVCSGGSWVTKKVCSDTEVCNPSTNSCDKAYVLTLSTQPSYYNDSPITLGVQLLSSVFNYSNVLVKASLETPTGTVVSTSSGYTDNLGYVTINLNPPSSIGNYVVKVESSGYVQSSSVTVTSRGVCSEGSMTCSDDLLNVLKCQNGVWKIYDMCGNGEKCNPLKLACEQTYGISLFGLRTFKIGENINFSVNLDSSIGDVNNVPVSVKIMRDDFVVQSSTKNTNSYGSAWFDFNSLNPGVYQLVVEAVGKSVSNVFNVTNTFKLEYYDTPIQQYNNKPLTVGIRILDYNNAPVTNVNVIYEADISGMPLQQPNIQEDNPNEFKLTWADSSAGTATVKFTLSKPNYQTTTFTKVIEVLPTSFILDWNTVGKKSDTLVEYPAKGVREWDVYVKSVPDNNPVDVDKVLLVINGVPKEATKVSLGTYKVSYNFVENFYDVSLKAVSGNKSVSKRVSVTVFGGSTGATISNVSVSGGGSVWSSSSNTTFQQQQVSSPSHGNLYIALVVILVIIVGAILLLKKKKR